MAIEIIPKPKVKKAPLINVLLYLCLILLIVFVISYFILDNYQKKLDKELSDLEKALERTPEEQNLEEELLGYQKKIRNFGALLNYHQAPRSLFNFLEKITHPKVWFSKFSLDLETSTVNISGQTDSFETLGQQIIILRKEELIEGLNLAGISISREGEIGFDLQLTFDPQIFTPLEILQPWESFNSPGDREFLTGFK